MVRLNTTLRRAQCRQDHFYDLTCHRFVRFGWNLFPQGYTLSAKKEEIPVTPVSLQPLHLPIFNQDFMTVLFCSAQDTKTGYMNGACRSNPYKHCQGGEERRESATAFHLQTTACTRESCGPPSDPSSCFMPPSVRGDRWVTPCPTPKKWYF